MDAEFKSKLEELVDHVFELKFPSSAGFRPLSTFFSPESVAHPAKANLFLVSFLIEKFTKEGEVVADVMAGTGSTGIVSSYLGRRSILVELEDKFIEWIKKNVECLEKHGGKKGEIKVLKGDARKLTELLGVNADSIITSPPYSESMSKRRKGHSIYLELEKTREMPQDSRDDNIANLYHGDVDAVITSPPYSNAISKQGGKEKVTEIGVSCKTAREYSSNPENIGNLPLGEVDVVITSPPYSNIVKSKEGAISPHMQGLISKLSGIPIKEFAHNVEKLKEAVAIAQSQIPFKYSDNPENVGNLPHGDIDVVITSPPYAESVNASNDPARRAERMLEAGLDPETIIGGKARCGEVNWKYGESKEQIGNLPHGEISIIITSPPYADSRKQPSKIDVEREVSSMETDTRPDTKNRHTLGRIRE